MVYSPRFPEYLQQARLRYGWKQTRLAEEVDVKLRTLISWETGDRIPPVGIVARLSILLETDLLSPYVADDLARHYGQDATAAFTISEYTPIIFETVLSGNKMTVYRNEKHTATTEPENAPSSERPQPHAEATASLGDLFQILELLRKQPALIPVTLDFLRTLTQVST